MATSVFEDLIIPAGEVRTYTQNYDSGYVGALAFAPPEGGSEQQPSLINRGEMRFQQEGYGSQIFIRFATDSSWDDAQIRNYGVISAVVPTADNVKVLYASSWSPNLWNAGTIVAQASYQAIVYESWDHSLTINNVATGKISATAQQVAFGLYLANGGTVNNAGDITATAFGGRAYAISLPGTAMVTNSGLIQATDNSADLNAIGVSFYGLDGNTVVNSGTIRGDYAIRENNPYEYNSRALVHNTGLIEGLVSLAYGNDRVVNSGQIVGGVDLGGDHDVYDGQLGSVVGTVLGDLGNDLLLGGAGRDTLDGGSGDDALFGRGGDTLTGGAGGDTFVYAAVTAGGPAEAITDFVSGTDRIDLRHLAPTSVKINGSTVSAVTAAGTLTINVTGAVALADILTGAVSDVTGTAGEDALVAGPGGAVLGGGDGADLLVGGTGNDRLDGGRGDSIGTYGDVMWGGAGDDTYVVNENRDFIVENSGGGYDTIELIPADLWQGMYRLPDHVERVIGGGAEGNALDNVMTGSSEGDLILGRDGNDSIEGGAGYDVLNGDAGNDTIVGGADPDVIQGGAGDDVIAGGAGADTLRGGDGADVFVYSAPADSTALEREWLRDFEHGTDLVDVRAVTTFGITFEQFNAGTANAWTKVTIATTDAPLVLRIDGTADLADFLYVLSGQDLVGTSGSDTLQGGPGPDTIDGRGGNDVLTGLGGDDVLTGRASNDTLIGEAGNDTLNGGAGQDEMIGGLGDDSYVVDNLADTIVEGPAEGTDSVQTALAGYTLGANIENLTYTGAGVFSGTGNTLANRMSGGSGNDVLMGFGGRDVLIGGSGNDLLDGGYGIDTVDYADAGAGVNVRLDRTTAQDTLGAGIDTLASIEHLVGSQLADKLIGNALDNVLEGGAGDDLLDGRAGADVLRGGAGSDTYFVDDAGDIAVEFAGEGTDRVISSVDFVLGNHVENLSLRGDARYGTGNGLDNAIQGSGGKSTLAGLGGADTINGGSGFDALDGGAGNDVLTGGIGKDRLTGGAGLDQFEFFDGDLSADRALTDLITDFSQAQGDFLKLKAIDADTTLAGDQKFVFIGAGAFTGTARELHYMHAGGNTYIEGDTDGDGLADFALRLDGLHNLVGADLVL